MIWLEIDSVPSLGLYQEPAARTLPGTDLVLPGLLSIGTLNRPLSIPGLASGENSSLSVQVDNAGGRLMRQFQYAPPVRTPARVVSEAGELWRGIITDIELGDTATLRMESGIARPLSDTIPLRNTTAWGEYEDVKTLPVPFGTVTLQPIQYGTTGREWVVADGAIAGVDAVTVDDEPIQAWTWLNGLDLAGQPVAFLSLANAVDRAETIRVTLRGRMDPDDGHLLTRPDEVLHAVLDFCGHSIDRADLDDFRVECTELGLSVGGVLDDATRTIRAQVDQIIQSVGGSWSAGAAGLAFIYPFATDSTALIEATATRLNAFDVVPSISHAGLANVLRVKFDYNAATSQHDQVVQIENAASILTYGRIETEWDAGWLHESRHADALGRRLLAWLAAPRWRVEWAMPRTDLRPGEWVDLQHPASPVSGQHRLIGVETHHGNLNARLVIEAAIETPVLSTVPLYRQTESGDLRITQTSDNRILE